jgi:hypothetical protein
VVSSTADTVQAYLAALPEDRRSAIARVRSEIKKHLPSGYQEAMQYGMISYVVPLSRYPETPNGQPLAVAALASQKNYMAVYLMGIYRSPALRSRFEAEYKASGKRLDAGKSCVRFKRLDDLALDAVAGAVARVSVDDCIAMTEAARGGKAKASGAKPVKPANAKPANAQPAKATNAQPAKATNAKAANASVAKAKAIAG